MPNTAEAVGELSKTITTTDMSCQIEWTIKDIYSLKQQLYDSPPVLISNCNWLLRLRIHPYCTDNPDAAWMSLYLHKDQAAPPKGVNFSLGVKKPDGDIERKAEDIWIFDEAGSGYGLPRFLKRTELIQRRLELAPMGHLTVTCCMDVTDNISCPAYADSLSSDLAELFSSKLGCDAILKVQQKNFPVHKCILSARSPVFAAMFQVDMKEKQTGIVEIVDCDPSVFEDFLAYLYTGKFQNSSENVWGLYGVADKYCVKKLKSACVLHAMSRVSLQSVCESASLADAYGEYGLQEKTQMFFNANFGEIICTPNWEQLLVTNSCLANDMLKKMVRQKRRLVGLNLNIACY